MSIDRESLAASSSNSQQIQQSVTSHPSTTTMSQVTTSQSSNSIANNSSKVSSNVSNASSNVEASTSSAAALNAVYGPPSMPPPPVPMQAVATSSIPVQILQEPDVIASTKLAHSKTTDSITLSGPIAPPRRKKKSRKFSSSSSEQFSLNEGIHLNAGHDNEDTDSDARSVQSVRVVQQKLRDALVKEIENIENSWNDSALKTTSTSNATLGMIGGLGNLSLNSSAAGSTSTVVSASNGSSSIAYTSSSSNRPVTTAAVSGGPSINRTSHSLGNSSTSVYSKPSPSNSAKSNSAPGRVRYL